MERESIMKRSAIVFLLFAVASAAVFFVPGVSSADEIKLVGVITKIEIAGPDATTASATLRDNKTDAVVTVIVNDELTLDKFKDHRIVEGDEIRLKYEVKDGKNISKYFRKTAGC
jgi:ethanolamine utilization protein EutP (predicted NTPase)